MKDGISCIDRFVDILECGLMIMCWTILLGRQMLEFCGYIRMWIDDNVLDHIIRETDARVLWIKLE